MRSIATALFLGPALALAPEAAAGSPRPRVRYVFKLYGPIEEAVEGARPRRSGDEARANEAAAVEQAEQNPSMGRLARLTGIRLETKRTSSESRIGAPRFADRRLTYEDLDQGLGLLPEFADRLALAYGTEKRFQLGYDRLAPTAFGTAIHYRTGERSDAYLRVKALQHEGSFSGDVVLTAVHELTHATDPEFLGKQIADSVDRGLLPPGLASRDKGDLLGESAYQMPSGVFVEETFWDFLTEQSAYGMQDRVFNGERADLFQGVRAPYPVRYPRSQGMFSAEYAREQLRKAGYTEAEIRALDLPTALTLFQLDMLVDYGPRGFGQLDHNAHLFTKYYRHSAGEILDGALKRPARLTAR